MSARWFCDSKTEVAYYVSFKGLIVQGAVIREARFGKRKLYSNIRQNCASNTHLQV